MRQVPPKQWRGTQNFVTAIAADEHTAWRRHDVVIDGVLLHERSNVVARHHRVFEDWLHLSEVSTELGRYANVAFDHSEQRSVDHGGDDLKLRHVPFLTGWGVSFAFPCAFPRFDNFNLTSNVCRVCFRAGQKRGHRLSIQLVRFLVVIACWAAVKIAAVELVSRMRLCAPTVYRNAFHDH